MHYSAVISWSESQKNRARTRLFNYTMKPGTKGTRFWQLCLGLARSGCTVQIAEEFALRIHHEQITCTREGLAIGIETTVERIELGITVEGIGIDGCRLGIALASDDLGFTERIRQDHRALTVGIRTDTLGQLLTTRTQLTGKTQTFRTHTLIHRTGYFLWQLDALAPHIDHLDTQLILCQSAQRADHRHHHLFTRTGDHFGQGTLTKLITQAGFNTRREKVGGTELVTGGGGVVLLDIVDTPLDERIHDQSLGFQRQESLRPRIQRHDATFEFAHDVDKRNLEMQTRLDIRFDYFTEAQFDCALGFLDDVDGLGADHDHNQKADQTKEC